jgi:1,4-dihydroxy-2-naphthoyl-CoA hydrolase
MSIWKRDITPSAVNQLMAGTMCEHVGMAITEIGPDYLVATMPVDERTRQHMGIIHGGASVVLAETLGSLGSMLCCPEGFHIVGLDINANHIRAGRPPHVIGTAKPVHIGSSTMVWDIRIVDLEDKLVCISRLTCAVLEDR